ncbi:MAG: hypothetical protein ACLFVC_09525 [Opitutales bacterium]
MDTDLYIDLPRTTYRPGATLSGEILWALKQSPESLHLSLGWWTEGRGTKDAKIEVEREWSTREPAGREAFEFQLPETPYSFDGQLISLKWALELRSGKGGHECLMDLVLSPGGAPIELPLLEDESPRKSFSFGRPR